MLRPRLQEKRCPDGGDRRQGPEYAPGASRSARLLPKIAIDVELGPVRWNGNIFQLVIKGGDAFISIRIGRVVLQPAGKLRPVVGTAAAKPKVPVDRGVRAVVAGNLSIPLFFRTSR